jgi:hypothetical protein
MSEYMLEEWVVVQHNIQIPESISLRELVLEWNSDCDGLDSTSGDYFKHPSFFLAVSRRGRLYTLNLTASLILEEILAGRTPTAIAEFIASEFDTSLNRATEDVTRIIQNLISKHIVVKI